MNLNKILCFTLPISWILFLIFRDSTYSWIFSGIVNMNMFYAVYYLSKYNRMMHEVITHLNHLYVNAEYDATLIHLDSDTILYRFKKKD